MDHLAAIDGILAKLRDEGYSDLADELLGLERSASTGGELLMEVCWGLLRIKAEHPIAYSSVNAQTESLISYANSIGLYPVYK